MAVREVCFFHFFHPLSRFFLRSTQVCSTDNCRIMSFMDSASMRPPVYARRSLSKKAELDAKLSEAGIVTGIVATQSGYVQVGIDPNKLTDVVWNISWRRLDGVTDRVLRQKQIRVSRTGATRAASCSPSSTTTGPCRPKL